MGKLNSSVYRVRPLMITVEKDIHAFEKLLQLVNVSGLSVPKSFRYDGTDTSEMQLKPSKKHLEKLIYHMASRRSCTTKNKKRQQLFSDIKEVRESAIANAVEKLNKEYDTLSSSDKKWYIFEGFTNPDIFIEGDDYIIVCEGKWTEPHITTETANLKKNGEFRNQMVRHIQGALNYANKKVYAFYIADKNCGYLKDLEKDEFKEQLSKESIELCDKEKDLILNSFYGYTTWQEIEKNIEQVKFLTADRIKNGE